MMVSIDNDHIDLHLDDAEIEIIINGLEFIAAFTENETIEERCNSLIKRFQLG